MNPIKSLAAAIDHTRRANRLARRVMRLADDYHTETGVIKRSVIAQQIADKLDAQARHLGASRLARVLTVASSSDGLRADARIWRKSADVLLWGVR